MRVFGFGKKRPSPAEELQALAALTKDKCQTALEECHKLEDPAARYLALANFQQARSEDIAALDRELEKKRESRNFYKALGLMAPFSIGFCLTHPAGWAVLGAMKMAGSAVMLLTPAGVISDSLNRGGSGRRTLQKKMAPLYAPLQESRAAAGSEMESIALRHIEALARSPLAGQITSLTPQLKDRMLESFRAAAAREPVIETPATPEALPPKPVFKL